MAILSKGYTFAGGQVDSSKLNSLVDLATFAAGSVADGTLSIDAGGGLKVGTIQTGNIAALSITTAKLADSTGASDGVTTAKLATGAVTTAKITDSAVTTAKIADLNITTAKIADANVTAPKLSGAQTGTAPVYGIRAWVSFNSAGTILGSGNVTSVTKIGTGKYKVTMTTAMPDANFCVMTTAGGAASNNGVVYCSEYATRTTTECYICFAKATDNSNSGVLVDPAYNTSVAILR